MSFWERIHSFFLSELWWKIYFIMFIVYVVLEITTTIIDKYLERKAVKQFEKKVYKYGIPKDFEAPDSVWYHIGVLIELCEKYELDSLYEAQDKFDELFTSHWRSIKLSDREMEILQGPDTDEKQFLLRALRHGEGVERANDNKVMFEVFERARKLSYEAHGGGMFHDPQRPDDYIEDKPDDN